MGLIKNVILKSEISESKTNNKLQMYITNSYL